MIAPIQKNSNKKSTDWRDRLMEMLPQITGNARRAFSHLSPEEREAAVAEVVFVVHEQRGTELGCQFEQIAATDLKTPVDDLR